MTEHHLEHYKLIDSPKWIRYLMLKLSLHSVTTGLGDFLKVGFLVALWEVEKNSETIKMKILSRNDNGFDGKSYHCLGLQHSNTVECFSSFHLVTRKVVNKLL